MSNLDRTKVKNERALCLLNVGKVSFESKVHFVALVKNGS